jgi:hypothetical protein
MLGVKIRDVLKLHNISQALEDRTLSGTPQCPSYLIAIKKKCFIYNIYTHVQYVFI